MHSTLGNHARKCAKVGFIGLAAFAAACSIGSANANARERVVLPWTCIVENGRLRVEPSAEQSYPIAGLREQQSHAACFGPNSNRCKTWMIHRFAVACQGGRVPWVDVVAATVRDRNRITVDAGALTIRTGPRQSPFSDRDCATLGQAPWRSQVNFADCTWSANGFVNRPQRPLQITLPRGFAPLGLAGARLIFEADPAPKAKPIVAAAPTVGPDVTPAPASTVAAFASQALSPVPVAMPAATVASPAATVAPAAVKRPAWTTKIEQASFAAPDNRIVTSAGPAWQQPLALLLVIAAILAATTALILRQRRQIMPLRPPMTVQNPPNMAAAPDGQRATALQSRAGGQMVQVRAALDRLSAVPPLRNALARELAGSERRLSVVLAATVAKADSDPEAWRRACSRMERVVHDLDRLQQIVDGAVTSLSGLTQNRALPRDVAEAYTALGVNPGVSDQILKKLVDALRVSWHPDLATGAEDRALRDERIKEINVAWDLITGKRIPE